MLDTDTRRRIDAARDILVGKVPDPKSQVEQITIALIYKFMDDMDAESEELGGERSFFAGEFARYAWPKLVRAGLGGHETLSLYAEAIARMPENPGIPPLFRDIFKNAYLPYRDPETLRAFLKIIDEFTYDHSERLGDAFEYLLSVLGSQGDAGQFRTPRHIIDFIVEVVDPRKDETLLDPACGTAGFLIASYKHILRADTDAQGRVALTPDEKARLARNMTGYDISPDMVRLSLVNMYLHGFADPHIHEYDTLTSQDRWNDYADVILANPPFMSPTGGIKPHNRFSVPSKRSEVLFVDYIAEHLTPNGRAGIIVPEGIIFQSQNAYTKLRKMLVEDLLIAVISLPQGIFNPYSGVKTSVLILDKSRARRSSDILFVRVDDDGHDLGATRRRTGEGDLPEAQRLLGLWFSAIDSGDDLADFLTGIPQCLLVSREDIAASGNYKLSADTYRKIENRAGNCFPWVPLRHLLGARVNNRVGDDTSLPVLSITMKHGLVDQSDKFKKRIASADITAYRKVARNELVVGFPIDEGVLGVQSKYPFAAVSPAYNVWTINEEGLDLSYFELLLRSPQARSRYRLKMRGTVSRRRTLEDDEFLKIEFPLPPLDVQQQIVAEIDGYQRVIDGARAVLAHYRPHIPIRPEWAIVELSKIIEDKPRNGYSGKPVNYVTNIKVLSLSATTSGTLDITQYKFLDEDIPANSPHRCKQGDIYLQRGNTKELVGTAAIFDVDEPDYIYPDLMIRVRANETKVLSQYLLLSLQSKPARDYLTRNAVGAAGSMPKINQGIVERIPIPLPPLATQQQIVAEIEAEQALVNANRELAARMERKIQAALARVWGDDEPPPGS